MKVIVMKDHKIPCGCVPLSTIRKRERVEIVNKNGTSEDMRRLSDMGLCSGVEVEVIVPGSGSVPFLIGVSGSRIALEPSLANSLMVSRCNFARHGRHGNKFGKIRSFFCKKNTENGNCHGKKWQRLQEDK